MHKVNAPVMLTFYFELYLLDLAPLTATASDKVAKIYGKVMREIVTY